MTKQLAQPSDNQLQNLVAEIQQQFALCWQSYRNTLEHARAIGERLVAAKTLVAHGQWRHWVRDNLPFSTDTAERMMKLHREWDRLNAAPVRLLGVKDAIAYLAAENKKAKQGQVTVENADEAEEKDAGRKQAGNSGGGSGVITQPSDETAKLSIVTATCRNCGFTEFDEDGDCVKCHEPRVWPRPKSQAKAKATAEAEDDRETRIGDEDEDVAADGADNEPQSVRDCYLDSAEADLFSPEQPLDEDAFNDLESPLDDMELSLADMLDQDAVASLSDFDPLKVDLIRLQRAMEQVRAGLERKRPVAYAAW